MSLTPSHAAAMPSTILSVIYNKAMPNFPFCNSVRFSAEKEEKVVKPPQIPVAKKTFQLFKKDSSFILNASTMPIIKLPAMFTAKVPKGKFLTVTDRYMAYLSIEPSAPPKPTNKKFLIIRITDLLQKYI